MFHAVGMMAFCFGLLMLIIYMVKFAKKEMLLNLSIASIVLGILISALSLVIAGSVLDEDGWNMMEKYSGRGYMMNWDRDSDDVKSTEVDTTTSSTVAN